MSNTEKQQEVWLWATRGAQVEGRVMMHTTDNPMTVWVEEDRALVWQTSRTPGVNAFSTLPNAVEGCINYCQGQIDALQDSIERLQRWRDALATGQTDTLNYGMVMEYPPGDKRAPCDFGGTSQDSHLPMQRHQSDFYVTAYPGRYPELHACFRHHDELVDRVQQSRKAMVKA